MAAPKKPNKEPLIHITKRRVLPWYHIWGIRAAAIIAALIVCGILTTVLTGLDPVSVYVTMIKGSFGTTRKIWVLLQELAMLLIVALALAPAYRMKFWNLGGEGQILAGGLATAACMILLGGKIPNPLLIVIMIVLAMAAGAFWAFIPAFFKAKFNTNETLFTLMMNYVALQIVAYFIIIWEVPKGSGSIGIINQSSQNGWFPQIGNKYLLNILIVAAVTVVMFIYMRYSKHGYEISVVGESHNTARYVGIKVDRVIIRTLILSGAICGLAGLLLVGSINHTITTSITGGRGFTAVMVAWLAKFDPFGMAASSFLLVFLERGAGEITTIYGLNQSFGDILTGIILFFIIGSNFFISYRIHFRKSAKHSAVASELREMIPEVEGAEPAEAAEEAAAAQETAGTLEAAAAEAAAPGKEA